MARPIHFAAPAVLALLGACAELPVTSPAPNARNPASTTPASAAASWSGSTLYARDGSAVDSDQGGSAAAPRELAPSEGGRMYILELYQDAIDARDALEMELRTQQSELDRTKQSLAQSDQEITALQAQLEQARAENRRLLDENLDLAARLTTAQIRRLQVEKILLESRIEEQRAAAALAQTQVSRNP